MIALYFGGWLHILVGFIGIFGMIFELVKAAIEKGKQMAKTEADAEVPTADMIVL